MIILFKNLIGKVIGMVGQIYIRKQTTLSTKLSIAFKNLQFSNCSCEKVAHSQAKPLFLSLKQSEA
jgi:hypothetical protein